MGPGEGKRKVRKGWGEGKGKRAGNTGKRKRKGERPLLYFVRFSGMICSSVVIAKSDNELEDFEHCFQELRY